MISLKVLSTVAAVALVLPMAASTASLAQGNPHARGGGGGAPHVSGGGGAPRMGGGGAPRMSAGAAPRMAGGGGGGVRMGGGAPGPRYNGGGGGGYHYNHGGGGGGFFPGAVAGAVIGGAIASQGYYGSQGYYAGPGYYAQGSYDDQYYDDGAVAVAPAPDGDDSVGYCMQTYRSYDPRSGTYLGNDGYRHPCP